LKRLNDLIIDRDIAIEQLKCDVSYQKSTNYNMLIRNIEVIDEIYLQPIKNRIMKTDWRKYRKSTHLASAGWMQWKLMEYL
jgi:hypothetical protein